VTDTHRDHSCTPGTVAATRYLMAYLISTAAVGCRIALPVSAIPIAERGTQTNLCGQCPPNKT